MKIFTVVALFSSLVVDSASAATSSVALDYEYTQWAEAAHVNPEVDDAICKHGFDYTPWQCIEHGNKRLIDCMPLQAERDRLAERARVVCAEVPESRACRELILAANAELALFQQCQETIVTEVEQCVAWARENYAECLASSKG